MEISVFLINVYITYFYKVTTYFSRYILAVNYKLYVVIFYRGHPLLIVNVASECGLTATNYKELVELDEKYRESKGLRILAFPCNQFGGQVSISHIIPFLPTNSHIS